MASSSYRLRYPVPVDGRTPVPVSTGPAGFGLTLAPTQPAPGVIVVQLVGEFDILTAPRCREVLRSSTLAVRQECDRHATVGRAARGLVVCDLNEVAFLSASGLGVLVEIDELASRHGVDLVVLASTRRVLRVLTVTGLDRELRVHRTLWDGVPSDLVLAHHRP